MTQTLRFTPTTTDAASQLIDLLERHRDRCPYLEEDLARYRTLSATLADQRCRGEHALGAWRTALARRWDCEVAAQRVYSAVQRQLGACYGDDPAYGQLIAPAQPAAVGTPGALLREVRRLEAALELLAPRPQFADEGRARLRAAANDLAAAIEQTDRYEALRRSALAEQRVVASLLERACARARRALAKHMPDADLA
ncbi:MAG: hypothetical protein HGA45_00280 [Chloroflexales bacterium]|nr:hypothetical protein [Chloroflexales bacterium]